MGLSSSRITVLTLATGLAAGLPAASLCRCKVTRPASILSEYCYIQKVPLAIFNYGKKR